MKSTADSPVRVAIVLKHPVQYFAPAFKELQNRSDVEPKVHFWETHPNGTFDGGFGQRIKWECDLTEGYNWWAPTAARALGRGLSLVRTLRRDRAQVLIVFGWASAVAAFAIGYACIARVPFVLYGDTNGRAGRNRAGIRGVSRAVLVKVLMRLASGALATGDANREFYIKHGMPAHCIFDGVLPARITDFHNAAAAGACGKGVTDVFTIGYVGKFIAVKGVEDLLRAAGMLPMSRPWRLWLVGDGELRCGLERLASDLGIAHRTTFFGFRNLTEVPAFVTDMDTLVLPSHYEPRGLVAVEAMAAGVAPIVSSATGVWGMGDAVVHGQTGIVYPAGDVVALRDALLELMGNPSARNRMATLAAERAGEFGPDSFAATTAAALSAVVARSSG